MAKAIFRYGEYRTIPYTAESAVTAGDVITIGDYPCVAHHNIAAGADGTLAIEGGVYDLDKDDSSGPNLAAGADVDWDDTDGAVAAGDGVSFGRTYIGADGSTTPVRVFHSPSGLSAGT